MTKNSEKTVIDLQQPEAKGEQDLSYADLTVDSPYWTDDTTAPGKASAFGQSDRVVPLIASTSNSKDTAVQDREGLPRSGVHIRWSKHVLALAVLALILAITLAYAHTGFILLLFIGLPLAIYSCWNDYNVQMGALRSSLKQAPRGSYGSLTLVENDETKKPELKSDEQLSGFLQAVRENHKLQKRLKVASNFDEVVSIAKQAGFIISKTAMVKAHKAKQKLELSTKKQRCSDISLESEMNAKEMWSLQEFANDARYSKEQQIGFGQLALIYCCELLAEGSLTQFMRQLGYEWNDETEARFWRQMSNG